MNKSLSRGIFVKVEDQKTKKLAEKKHILVIQKLIL